MTEDYAIFTGQRDLPHFGHLARELLEQKQHSLLRELLRKRELAPYNHYTVAKLLVAEGDTGTFEILIGISSPNAPLQKGDEGRPSNEGLISGEGVPDYSALALRGYLRSDKYRSKAEAHLIRLLKEHKRTGVRAFAALALERSKSSETVQALRAALKDKGYVITAQGYNDYVWEYARDALAVIQPKSK